jgi:riboflavin biosynthesis pyrimidine reductase
MAAAVVVGGRTVRAEGYEGLLGEEAKRRRAERGLPPEPELVIFTHASPGPAELWQEIRQRHPEGLIVCEGGPTLLGMIVKQRLLDQLIVGISPQIVGDDSQKRLLQHAEPLGVDLTLLAAAADDGFVFLRYGLAD